LRFLVSQAPEAVALRQHFVFKMVPMLNPDGVAHGNTRCGLAGCDLNRRWDEPLADVHPTVFHTKQLIQRFASERELVLFCDLHGHSRRFNVFTYGCAPTTLPPADAARARLFPLVLSRLSAAVAPGGSTPALPAPAYDGAAGRFRVRDCGFKVQASKAATGRVVCWQEVGIANSYTLEASFCGVGDNALVDARCVVVSAAR
jgi:hypothetical protein